MGLAAAPGVNSAMPTLLDRFFEHYYQLHPVNATFTGIHDYDHMLPDWSPAGLEALADANHALAGELRQAYDVPASGESYLRDPDLLDAQLAREFLTIELAEMGAGGVAGEGTHGVRRNPALWTGEAVFSIVSLLIRNFAPAERRAESVRARLSAIPSFLVAARDVLGGGTNSTRRIPEAWISRALRDCAGADILFSAGVDRWLRNEQVSGNLANRVSAAARLARFAMAEFADWLRAGTWATESAVSCGPPFFDLLTHLGHHCHRTRWDLLSEARDRFEAARSLRDESARRVAGSWAAAQEALADDHAKAPEYLAAFGQTWNAARQAALAADVVTWPDWPIRYVAYPECTAEAAPHLYYLHYRSPAPFDEYKTHDYVVPVLPPGDSTNHLRAWNSSVMKLNHVVHHGGIGHHVQNWHATHQQRSRIGTIAAVDCANRIGMFCGGTMAEGWATYVTGLMSELGFLTPLEQVADQHTAVRVLGRAIVDIELHQGETMSLSDAEEFYREEVGMSAAAARGEAVKNSMFPGTGIMYWLGTQGIRDLRAALEQRRGSAWSLKTFHDELLGFGSIPVPLVAQLMSCAPPERT